MAPDTRVKDPELNRQFDSALYEILAFSKDKEVLPQLLKEQTEEGDAE